VGLLKERPVQPLTRHLVGKEGNKIEERMEGLALEDEEYLNEYVNPKESLWASIVVPVLATMNKSQLAREAGVDRTTIQRYVSRGVTSHHRHEVMLTSLAVAHARKSINPSEMPKSPSTELILTRYLATYNRRVATDS
jgi:hypothetical protein